MPLSTSAPQATAVACGHTRRSADPATAHGMVLRGNITGPYVLIQPANFCVVVVVIIIIRARRDPRSYRGQYLHNASMSRVYRVFHAR